MVSCNDMYNHKGINIYEFLYNNPISKEKSKIYLCLENMWIIKLLFQKYKFIEYDKRYEMSKKKYKPSFNRKYFYLIFKLVLQVLSV